MHLMCLHMHTHTHTHDLLPTYSPVSPWLHSPSSHTNLPHPQASTLDFTKAPEPSLTVATLLGSCIKAAGPLLLGAAPDLTPAAAGGAAAGSSGSSMPLPQELLNQQVGLAGGEGGGPFQGKSDGEDDCCDSC